MTKSIQVAIVMLIAFAVYQVLTGLAILRPDLRDRLIHKLSRY